MDEYLSFLVVGDIGDVGPTRVIVADAMARLNAMWRSDGKVPPASFVLTTGDNIYKKGRPTAEDFDLLVNDMISKLPVPWFATVGNHDVKAGKYDWHTEHNNTTSEDGWSFHCPSPAYSLDEVVPGVTKGLIDIFVINTNKLQSGWPRGGTPPGPSTFYKSNNRHWWKEQKQTLTSRLADARSQGKWTLVTGHHPVEYVPLTLTEHHIPGLKYFKTTYMRGGRQSKRNRVALSHVLRRGSDIYLCGHQHLMSEMSMSISRKRSRDETKCRFIIVGNSSKTEEDPEDFGEFSELDFAHPNKTDKEGEPESTHQKDDEDVKIAVSNNNGNIEVSKPNIVTSKVDTTSANPRYQSEWVCQGKLGFSSVHVTRETLTYRFYVVDSVISIPECVHEHTLHRDDRLSSIE